MAQLICIYIGKESQTNLYHGIQNGIWGFKESVSKELVKQFQFDNDSHILIATGFTGGSPRVDSIKWNKQRVNKIYFAKLSSDFIEGENPEWPDEVAAKRVEYSKRLRFERNSLAEFADVSLKDLPESISESLRSSAIAQSRGYLIPDINIKNLREVLSGALEERLEGLVVCDDTGWYQSAIQELSISKYIVLWWDKRPTGIDPVIELLEKAIHNSEQNCFYIYYSIKQKAKYRARIIDFALESNYKDKDWKSYNKVAWLEPNFSDYMEKKDQGKDKFAKIVFLADELIELDTPISMDRFNFYKNYYPPTQNNMQPFIELIEANDFDSATNRKVWFVCQGATFKEDKGMKFLWAPEKGTDERSRFYWDNVSKVKKGDIIFNYSEGAIRGVSLADSDGYAADNIDSNSPWNLKGYRVDIELYILDPPIYVNELIAKKKEFKHRLQTIAHKPFQEDGGVNQGYLYEFTKEAGQLVKSIYGKKFGNEIIDSFFEDGQMIEEVQEEFSPLNFINSLKKSNLSLNEYLINRFINALISKPFLILTGLSGSGKTKLAHYFVSWLSKSDSKFCLLPVGSDWTNREPLLGYPDALNTGKYIRPDNDVLDLIIDSNRPENADKPFFLILDEMNLSHVERYFADFLSAMESGEPIPLHSGDKDWDGVPAKLYLGKNLFIIGTVNIDETTYMFSPKVLDRANVIEFQVSGEEMSEFLNNPAKPDLESIKGAGSSMAADFVAIASGRTPEFEDEEKLKEVLMKFFSELKPVGAEFGYRTASEIYRFAGIISMLTKRDGSKWYIDKIIDAAVMQKLLPKLHGSRRKLEPVLVKLAELCLVDNNDFEKYLKSSENLDFNDEAKVRFPLSLEKINRMYSRVLQDGFTSFADA
jgi:hypothetical protein